MEVTFNTCFTVSVALGPTCGLYIQVGLYMKVVFNTGTCFTVSVALEPTKVVSIHRLVFI